MVRSYLLAEKYWPIPILLSATLFAACNPAPVFSVSNPKNGNYVNAATATALPVSGLCDTTATAITLSGAGTAHAACSSGTWSTTVNVSAAADGPINIMATESVSSGTTPAPISIALIKDTTTPAVTVEWPAANSTIAPINAKAFIVRGSCTENGASVAIKGAVIGNATCDNDSWKATLDFSTAPNGNVTITASQADAAGNASDDVLSLVKVPKCTTQQLDQLASNVVDTLSHSTTDVPFSFDIKTEDGRELAYSSDGSTMSTPYQSASTSKWVSASVILSYVESAANLYSAHPLTLDSHPQDFLDSNAWPVPATDPLSAITLRQLLSFTSGLTEEPACINAALPNGSFANCVKAIATANIGNGKTPGAEFWYSSNHLQVAGMMSIAAHNKALGISNSTWQDLFSEFKTKTGLFPNSVYNLPSQSNPRLAGGMTWTGSDYLQFIAANYAQQILSSQPVSGESVSYQQQQLTDQIANATIGSSPVSERIRQDWHYGFGLWLECHSAVFDCQYGVDSYSSPGAYGAYPFMNLTNKFYGIVARQGDLGTFHKGYELYEAVQSQVVQWASESCPL